LAISVEMPKKWVEFSLDAKMPQLTITTDSSPLYFALKNDPTDGVSIISGPPALQRGLDFHATVNITLSSDLGHIALAALSAWLLRHLRHIKGHHYV
jgi:hypothetical protein